MHDVSSPSMQRDYVPPLVIRIRDLNGAAGNCGPGSSDTDVCTSNGGAATTSCDTTGSIFSEPGGPGGWP